MEILENTPKERFQASKQKMEKAAYILKTVAHPVRLAIIELLNQQGEMGVNDICKALDCEQSLISHHLINMKLRGILQSHKDGLNVYYDLKEKEIVKLLQCIENCDCNM
ncbi:MULTISPECIES: metalloregulator ArsR/SmtB family transcription factor [unclassified Arcicella]|uniref:ArsR/SmtB family transcription factor n=1 Tax=unclassified Arcicella TaxID=2644986 RepID=UPI0028615318|nr:MULTISPECIES: metalloregulator ArsR/SmtB family transcription factor [unclassified Arcicella]MDR6561914.1 ArsR family transcriptional regulator [Arcicella sp. BE51]MDR6811785.1 ArsR family transcriptional regulator [Arcicella sp. BE140]MDR6822815.1 ArsR family transcriptional regulator [Arcicella sp. BE139]